MHSVPPLRIAVLGAGNIGSAFAFRLALRGQHDVTLIARPGSSRLHQLQRDAAIVAVDGERAPVTVGDRLDEQLAYDLVIVTVLAHQLDGVLPTLQRSAARRFLFLLNQFDPDQLQARLGADRCDFGMPFVQAKINDAGKLQLTISAGTPKTKVSQQRWAQLFTAAGLPAAVEPHMMLWLRCHVPLCVAFESIAVAAVRRGGGATWQEARVVARGMQEGFRLIRGLGYEVYPAGKAWLGTSPAWLPAALLWSMSRVSAFRTLLAAAVAECRALSDTMIAAAQRADRPVNVASIAAMKPAEDAPG